MGGIFARKVEKVAQLCPIQSQYESRAHFGNFWPENDQKQKFGLRRGFFGPNQKVQKTKYVFTRPIHPPEVELNQNFEIGTLSPPSNKDKYNDSRLPCYVFCICPNQENPDIGRDKSNLQ